VRAWSTCSQAFPRAGKLSCQASRHEQPYGPSGQPVRVEMRDCRTLSCDMRRPEGLPTVLTLLNICAATNEQRDTATRTCALRQERSRRCSCWTVSLAPFTTRRQQDVAVVTSVPMLHGIASKATDDACESTAGAYLHLTLCGSTNSLSTAPMRVCQT
jgi:hypothetical protein